MTQIDKKEYKQLCVGAEKLETCIVLVGIKQEICVHLKKARYNNTTQKRRLWGKTHGVKSGGNLAGFFYIYSTD